MENHGKKRFILVVLLAFVFAFVLAFGASCKDGDDTDTGSESVPTSTSESPSDSGNTSEEDGSITLDKEVLELDLDEEATLTATVEGLTGKVVWKSSDEKVATVDNGKVTPKGEGVVNITATVGRKTAVCTVRVYNSYAAPNISLGDTSINLNKGDEYDVEVIVRYKGKDVTATTDYVVSYAEGSSETVARATKNGNKIAVTALGYGKAEFYVSATIRGVVAAAKFTVNVKTAGVTLDIANIAPENGVYTAKLATTNAGGYIRSIKPEMTVYEGGNEVENATIALESKNPAIAKVENGVISSVSVGETTVTANYNGNEFIIRVTVEKPTFVQSEKLLIEVGNLEDITYADNLAGTFINAKIGDVEVGSSFSGKTLVLDNAKLNKMPVSAYGEDKELIVETDEAYYLSPADVYTLVIRTVDDYNRMPELSKAAESSEQLYGGYFVLGNDLSQDGGIKLNDSFVDRYFMGGGTSGKGDAGFCGVFDGKGYTIDGFYKVNTKKYGAFIGMLAGGVIRNVSFTNFVMNDEVGCSVVHGGKGTVENVYVSYKAILNCNDTYSGTFFGANNQNTSTASITNCFVDTTNAEVTTAGMKFNVIGRGVTKDVAALILEGENLGPNGGIWGGPVKEYDLNEARTSSAFLTAVSNWDRNFWTVVNSTPVPKNLYEAYYADGNEIEIVTELPTVVDVAGPIEIRTNQNYYVISVDKDAANKGFTTYANTVIVPVTTETEVSVTVSSIFNSAVYTSFVFKTLGAEVKEDEVKLKTEVKVNGSEVTGGSETLTIDLSDMAVSDGTVTKATLGKTNLDVSSFSVENKVLTFNSSALGLAYGKQNLGVSIEQSDGSTKLVLISCLLVSKTIKTKADLDLIGVIGKACEPNDKFIWGGYFELGNDIDLSNESAGVKEMVEFIDRYGVHSSIATNGDEGFKGTIDGLGHKIVGLSRTGKSGTNAFITVMHRDGVLKNIAFTDSVMTATAGSFIVHVGLGTFENIYVSYKEISTKNEPYSASATFFGATGSQATLKAVIVDATNATIASGANLWLVGRVNNANGVFGIGNVRSDDASVVHGTKGVYADYDSFKPAISGTIKANIDSWDKTYWDMSKGYPKFKNTDAGEEVTYFTVTFDPNGGSAVSSIRVKQGEKITSPATPTKATASEQYTFEGWYNGDKKWDFANDTVSGNITLTAKWKLDGKYTEQL